MTHGARIVLIRHGVSAHPKLTRWASVDDARRNQREYNVAGLRPDDAPPPALVREASAADVLVASDLPRAIESVRRLAPERAIQLSPLLREIELAYPVRSRLRLPVDTWDAISFVRWQYRLLRGDLGEYADRVRDATNWLVGLADGGRCVVAVTHGSFRRLLNAELISRGWTRETRLLLNRHWGAWRYHWPAWPA